MRAGGGARLPSVAAKVAGWGLSGLEFGVNIPGTVGGAVRMNANAYGGQLAEVLDWVDVCGPGGSDRRRPEDLGFSYRSSNLGPGEVVAAAGFALAAADPDGVRKTMAAMRERRHEAQPAGIKTFGSTFKNPDDPRAEGRTAGQLLEAAGCRGLAHGGARFSEKHANFVENTGEATTADVLELMAAGPAPGPRALRDRPRARGAAARRGRDAATAGNCVRRVAAIVVLAVIAILAIYHFAFATKTVAPTVTVPAPVAAIGVGSDAVGVDSNGKVMATLAGARRRLAAAAAGIGTAEAAAGCAARCSNRFACSPPPRPGSGPISRAPPTAKPTGSASNSARASKSSSATSTQAALKWRSAAAVLADPATETLDYVDVQAPRRPAVGGSGHVLPPVE